MLHSVLPRTGLDVALSLSITSHYSEVCTYHLFLGTLGTYLPRQAHHPNVGESAGGSPYVTSRQYCVLQETLPLHLTFFTVHKNRAAADLHKIAMYSPTDLHYMQYSSIHRQGGGLTPLGQSSELNPGWNA